MWKARIQSHSFSTSPFVVWKDGVNCLVTPGIFIPLVFSSRMLALRSWINSSVNSSVDWAVIAMLLHWEIQPDSGISVQENMRSDRQLLIFPGDGLHKWMSVHSPSKDTKEIICKTAKENAVLCKEQQNLPQSQVCNSLHAHWGQCAGLMWQPDLQLLTYLQLHYLTAVCYNVYWFVHFAGPFCALWLL